MIPVLAHRIGLLQPARSSPGRRSRRGMGREHPTRNQYQHWHGIVAHLGRNAGGATSGRARASLFILVASRARETGNRGSIGRVPDGLMPPNPDSLAVSLPPGRLQQFHW